MKQKQRGDWVLGYLEEREEIHAAPFEAPVSGDGGGADRALHRLGGTTYAATGGNFILGSPNTATSATALTANIAGKALQLNNNSTGANATALGLSVASGKTPFTVNSGTKVANLNADLLDGLDSGSFVQGAAARTVFARRTAAVGDSVTVLHFPGFVDLVGTCGGVEPDRAEFVVQNLSGGQLDIGSTSSGAGWFVSGNTGAFVSSAGSVGAMTLVQVGQTFTPPGKLPRNRIVTFALASRFRSPCLFQAHALAQG